MAFLDNLFKRAEGIFSSSVSPITSASESSAMSESRKIAQEANAFNAAQAALNRQFQQSSAERSMLVSAAEAEKARQFSSMEAQKSRDWQERMSNTSYQRAMADLRASGLNPILLYSSLNGSSTPSGSTASSFAGSGSSASGSSASGYMADISSAKRVDLEALQSLVPVLLLQSLSSAADGIKTAITEFSPLVNSGLKNVYDFVSGKYSMHGRVQDLIDKSSRTRSTITSKYHSSGRSF